MSLTTLKLHSVILVVSTQGALQNQHADIDKAKELSFLGGGGGFERCSQVIIFFFNLT